ncbi:hypothetical protein L1049_027424 [Liquidambar formosana]|uniref:CASP-like protein n=1 Tax=Liquidambar formosana TaxID=63359 RepID=A0AAP0WSG7_LIQFO
MFSPAGVIGFAYTLFQIPFAVYYVSTGKRMISNDCLPEFDFYGDKVISYLLATGTGAGFGVTFEFKKFLNALFDSLVALNVAGADELRSKSERFLDRGNIATGLLFLGFLCMVVLSVLSSIDRNTSKGFSG